MCVSEQKGKPSCSTGGGLGDRVAILSQRHGVCVCVSVCVCMAKGKTILFHGGGGGGRVLLPPWPARTVAKPQGWGEGMPQEAEHKTAAG